MTDKAGDDIRKQVQDRVKQEAARIALDASANGSPAGPGGSPAGPGESPVMPPAGEAGPGGQANPAGGSGQVGSAGQDEPPKITSEMIRACLFENEKGDGVLFSTLFRDRFLFDKNTQEWFEWAGQ